MDSYQTGRVRRFAASDNPESAEVMLAVSPRGDGQVSQALPERTDLVRLGNSYGAAIPTGSAFTFVAAWPTTRAELVLWNGEPSNGKTYVIDNVWLLNVTSMGAAQPMTLLGQIAPSGLNIAAPTDNALVLRHNLVGRAVGVGSNARYMLANTAFALANHWFPIAGTNAPMTTNLGQFVGAVVYGRYLIPPAGAFCLAGLAGTAAGTAILGVEHHEVQLASP